jgi:putative transposase
VICVGMDRKEIHVIDNPKAIKTKGSFPTEDAARKLVYLAIQNAVPQWTRTRGWTKALLAFKIHFGDRLPD